VHREGRIPRLSCARVRESDLTIPRLLEVSLDLSGGDLLVTGLYGADYDTMVIIRDTVEPVIDLEKGVHQWGVSRVDLMETTDTRLPAKGLLERQINLRVASW